MIASRPNVAVLAPTMGAVSGGYTAGVIDICTGRNQGLPNPAGEVACGDASGAGLDYGVL